jgi:predicted ATPase
MASKGFLHELILRRERIADAEAYPYTIPALRGLETLPLDPQVTIFVGENGAGKSTLIEAIAICAGLNPEGGTKNFRFSTRATESSLHEALDLVRGIRKERSAFFLRAETMFNVATEVERLGLAEYGWADVHARSHGEAFLWIVQNRLARHGLYIFDEPESALSPQRQLALLRLLHDLVGRGSQLILATHSPILLAYPGALIYRLSEAGIDRIAYEDTEHYIVTRAFLNARETVLEELFRDD